MDIVDALISTAATGEASRLMEEAANEISQQRRNAKTWNEGAEMRGAEIERLTSDCMTLALRLFGEDPDTFAPETREVMDRWRPKCMQLLVGE